MVGVALAGLALGTTLDADEAGETDQASDIDFDLPGWSEGDR